MPLSKSVTQVEKQMVNGLNEFRRERCRYVSGPLEW